MRQKYSTFLKNNIPDLTSLTPAEITLLFYDKMKDLAWEKEANYLLFTTAHWENYKKVRDQFLSELGLSHYENIGSMQRGVMKYLNE